MVSYNTTRPRQQSTASSVIARIPLPCLKRIPRADTYGDLVPSCYHNNSYHPVFKKADPHCAPTAIAVSPVYRFVVVSSMLEVSRWKNRFVDEKAEEIDA